MTISLANITGSAQTGLTTPGYTITADKAVDVNGVQWAITALTGTQTGVVAHSMGNPFTVSYYRPKAFKTLGQPNPTTGRIANIQTNRSQLLTRKGVIPLAGQPVQTAFVKTYIEIPAGADVADPASIRAALSAHIGALSQISAGIGDTVITGVM